ncbi:MAG: aminopeptidase N [Pseudomonadales bacterium]
MKEGQPSVIYLKDYQVPDFLIEKTVLRFDIDEGETRVTSELQMFRNPAAIDSGIEPIPDLVLDGGAGLETLNVLLNDQELGNNEYHIDEDQLIIRNVPEHFTLRTSVVIKPHENLVLSGLYQSGEMLCTQCEAEGFRNITWYLDRPDVMSVFETTINAPVDKFPVLLSNGNAVARTDSDGRQEVTWADPFKKPAYLFALVAGDLAHVESQFITQSGRAVTLQIFTEAHNIDKVDFAMDSLKASMTWDETAYGREYDLDIYMIVAVESFNMGAMENKGLNIFNTSCVLAHQQTTTDAGFQRVEAVVAHEYFHNWSGNRVTCRDWFQLSLKEGFTVLRDQQFSADRWSEGVSRVEQVSVLRSHQFPEDAGPMAHPIRPPSFIEINNFYTATVYEKGAEVVRMLHTLLGPELFRAGTDLYFERHDGEAVTTEDFVQALEAASGFDLRQFRRWYDQAGTPEVDAQGIFDEATQTYRLTLSQKTPATPGQAEKLPLHMPITVGLIGSDGNDLGFTGAESVASREGVSRVLSLQDAEQTFVLEGVKEKPLPSLARSFSAPIKLNFNYSNDELCFLSQHDSDAFNRWEAGQRLAVRVIQDVQAQMKAGNDVSVDQTLIDVFQYHMGFAVDQAQNADFDGAMTSLMLTLPALSYLIELESEVDVQRLASAREWVRQTLATKLMPDLLSVYETHDHDEPYALTPKSVGGRDLKNLALTYLLAPAETEFLEKAVQQFERMDNMTDVSAALRALVNASHVGAEVQRTQALETFFERWSHEALVIDQWFSIQAACPRPGAIARIQALMNHSAYSMTNPNRMRSVLAGFAMQNLTAFHQVDGSGYRLLAERVAMLNSFNPQMAARMLGPLTGWRKFSEAYGQAMQAALQSILDQGDLSPDVYEVVTKSLA